MGSITDPPRTNARFRLVLGTATALMLGVSWPLWWGDPDVPRVPYVPNWPCPGSLTSAILGTVLGLSVLGFAYSRHWRLSFLISSTLFVVLILGDQHRFQPWVYQYLMVGLALTTLRDREARTAARLWFVSLYVHSGLSKLDVSFRDELGAAFLRQIGRLTGLDISAWPMSVSHAAVLAMPLAELLAGVALLSGRTRPFGLLGLAVMHTTLTLILGPLGLDHSALVQMWNIAMLIEAAILFWPGVEEGAPPGESHTRGRRSRELEVLVWILLLGGMVLPFGERWGWCDPWPAHALYASHVERISIDLHETGLVQFPDSVRRFASPMEGEPWYRLNLTAWNRAERGAPIYPGNRAGLGLAEGLIARYGGPAPARVILLGPANRWTGRRARTELLGLDDIRAWADRYRLNAHADWCGKVP